MDKNIQWFEELKTKSNAFSPSNPVAYFCAEFALTSSIPTYAGGLGVLAGDLIREANDRSFPMIGIGLYYNDGYETLHRVDEHGYIQEPHVHKPPETFGILPVLGKDEKQIVISIPIQQEVVFARAWVWQVGKIPAYLLDTDISENNPQDRKITDHLYVIDKETRLKQEIVLGIGGYRLLEALGIKPSIYHMNEGHSSLLALEVIKDFMQKDKLSFEQAREKAHKKIIFSNHTLVAGGQEVFKKELTSLLLEKYITELGVPLDEILSLGEIPGSSSFSLSYLALRVSGITNAVSQIHAEKAKKVWPEFSLIPITNGIHIPSWDSISDEENIWQSHLENKRAFLKKIQLTKGVNWSEKDLIIGWARRLVSYKRPNALLEDIPALKKLLEDKTKPFKIAFSGMLHPSDAQAINTFESFHNIIDNELKNHVIFLPEYNLDTARLMTSGCDVWANTPIVGFEACGTSGMKAALNGVLPLSTRDGWMAEIEFLNKGWPLDDDKVNQSIIQNLKDNILPLYFGRDSDGIPRNWLTNMRNCREIIKNDFSTTRMLREYTEKLYLKL